jgi:hypothetical protein
MRLGAGARFTKEGLGELIVYQGLVTSSGRCRVNIESPIDVQGSHA